jgi:hypothetical protein
VPASSAKAIESFRDLLIKNVRISRRRLDVGMAQCLLDRFQISCLAQQLGPQIMQEVVE